MRHVIKKQQINLRTGIGLLASSALLATGSMAWAQEEEEAEEKTHRVEVTGSSIKRVMAEGALPVQQLTQEDIKRSGANTIAELIQTLPAMQGFQAITTAVGTNSGGIVTASIHDLGASYTLVLLNGRRVAPQGSGSTINLNAIPMSAVERVEILTDGASALYGSDAIAGVINFIMKKNQKGGTVEATLNRPQESGGASGNINVSYGFGDLQEDSFNVLFAYSHDEQRKLSAGDRSFANSAYRKFNYNGRQYIFDQTSGASAPANVNVSFNNKKDPITGLDILDANGKPIPMFPGVSFNPYLQQNGNCPALSVQSLTNPKNCNFDYAATLDIYPESTRDSLFLTGRIKVNNALTLFSDVAYSRYALTAKIAPNAAPFSIQKGSANFDQYVLPFLTAEQAANVKSASGNYRTVDWGTRDSETITQTKHLVLGIDAEWAGWNIDSGFTWSKNQLDEKYVGGYFKDAEFRHILSASDFNPFVPAGGQSAATQQLIKNSLFNGSIRTASTTLTGLDARGSREMFELPGGDYSSIGIGADYRRYQYEQSPSVADDVLYNFDTPPAYDMSRNAYGAYAELLMPLFKKFELNTSVRHDEISAVDSKQNGLSKTIGETFKNTTYKISLRFQPTKSFLMRGSFGKGFIAPTMLEIAGPSVSAGFTGLQYECPFPNTQYCRPQVSQYNVITGGNANLKPEKSTQYTYGFYWEPLNNYATSVDFWSVEIKDALSSVSEAQAFADPEKFKELFSTYTEPGTGSTYYAFNSSSINIGKSVNRGLDWTFSGREKFNWGNLLMNASGTYLITSKYTEPGSSDKFASSLGHFGINNAVSFRNIIRLSSTLETGAFTNSLTANFKSGYVDASAYAFDAITLERKKITLQIPTYTTFDWQGKYKVNKELELRAGIKNLFNREPPFSLRTGGSHHVGYDPRYTDSFLRSFYVSGNYRF